MVAVGGMPAREGVTLDDAGLLRRVSFQAHAPGDGPTLARYVGIHLDGTRRRAVP